MEDERAPYVVAQELTDRWTAHRVCVALLNVLESSVARVHVEVQSDHRDDLPPEVRYAQVLLRMSRGPGVRHGNDTVLALADPWAHWLPLLVYASWTRYLAVFDADGTEVAVLRAAGSSITATLTETQVRALGEQFPAVALVPADAVSLAELRRRRDRHEERRDEERRRFQEQVEISAAASRTRPSRIELPVHPADAYAVSATATFTPAHGQPTLAVTLSVQGTAAGLPSSATAHSDRFYGGWFGVEPFFAPAERPDDVGSVPVEIHGRHQRLREGTTDVVVLAEGTTPADGAVPPVPGDGPFGPRPEGRFYGQGGLSTIGGCLGQMHGWSVHVQQAGECTLHLSAPVVRRRGRPRTEEAELLGTLVVVVRLAERSPARAG